MVRVVPLVFGGIYGFDIGAQDLVYSGIFVGLVYSASRLVVDAIRYHPGTQQADVKPEMVLPLTSVGSLALPNCLFWYRWCAREIVN